MVPKKTKDLYKLTAEQLGVSIDLVKDASEMYWSEIRKALTNMEFHIIYVDNLGVFKAKERRLREALERYEGLFKYNDGSSFRKMAMKTELESRIKNIKRLLVLIEQDKIKKQLIKAKRDGQTNNTSMEEQTPNTGGDAQLDIQEGSSREDLHKENEDM